MDHNTATLAEEPREAGIAADETMATGPRPGTYARGTETVDAILKAAHDVLIEEGASAFTIRRIASASGMKVGNVSYHFPRKEMLIKIMLDELLDSYDKLLESEVRQPAISPEDRLRLIVKLCLDDIAGKRTTRLFTELWALANHNPFVAERVRAFYQRVHDFIGEVITALNPALSPDEVQTLALYISASMEGTTPFLGFEKPWAAKMPQITAIAAEAMVSLVKTITPEQIARAN